MQSAIFRRCAILLAFALVVLVATPAQARQWLRAESDNFVVYSDGYRFDLERWVRKLERFDLLLRRRFDAPPREERNKLTVYMFESPRTVANLLGRDNVAGFYTRSSEGPFAITNRRKTDSEDDLSGQMTLFHEYAHHFMYRNFPGAYPAWYREGFAEYVSNAHLPEGEGAWTLGNPLLHRMEPMLEHELPVGTILSADVLDIAHKVRPAFYAWSWLLVHMLNGDPRRAGQLDAYLRSFQAGAGARQAARVAFGDLGALERDLRAYAREDLRAQASGKALTYDRPVRIAALDPVPSLLIDLRLARRAARDVRPARDELRRLAKRAPDNADILLELALAERKLSRANSSNDMSAAETAVNRALEIDADNPRANLLRATLTMERLAIAANNDPAAWNAARRRIAAAIRAAPHDPYVLLALFRSYLIQGVRPPGIAHAAMERAFALQPESTDIRLSYGYSLAFRGRFDDAMAVVQVLVSDPHAAEVGKQGIAALEQLRKTGLRPDPGSVEEDGEAGVVDSADGPPIGRAVPLGL